ncbi:MAG: ABC transporter ATP-binding protein [Thermodesulfobacteriota bacterium]|nr:ABC transporter ATP-binding protein [Thermodesulfobacteriota bacterium]
MLEIIKLRAYYDGIAALKGIGLKIEEGTILSIIGANGAGKSTLLKSISGLIKTKEGRIMFKGQDITQTQPAKIVGLGISQVPEGRQIFGHLTVEDNLNLGAYVYYRSRNMKQVKAKKEEVFSAFSVLQRRLSQLAGTLSGGEQQMLAIARAMMANPKLLLLDEPSLGLAPLIVQEIFRVIKRLNNQGATILLVEQNARAALRIAGYGYVLETGEVSLEGPTTDLLSNEAVKKAYLGA